MTYAYSKNRILAITFVVVTLIVWRADRMSFGHTLHEQQGPSISAQRESFKLILMGDGRDADCKGDPLSMGLTGKTVPPECVLLGWRVYEAADGSRANLIHGKFESPDVATKRLQSWMKSAKTVIQSEGTRDASGNVTGQRMVASFGAEDGNKDYFQVGQSEGRDSYLISSPSLSTALNLERWMAIPALSRR